jgi:hypothetical protein
MSEASVAEFRALHASGCFVLPNPWDVGSAVYLHRSFEPLGDAVPFAELNVLFRRRG